MLAVTTALDANWYAPTASSPIAAATTASSAILAAVTASSANSVVPIPPAVTVTVPLVVNVPATASVCPAGIVIVVPERPSMLSTCTKLLLLLRTVSKDMC